MDKMFCFQCEQTINGKGCTSFGACGKSPETAQFQDELVCELISLATIALGCKNATCCAGRDGVIKLLEDGLFSTLTNVNFSIERIESLIRQASKMRLSHNGELVITPKELFAGDKDINSLRSTLLFGLKGLAAYAHHARVLGKTNSEIGNWLIKGTAALAQNHSVDEWLNLLMELGGINLKCMKLLEQANVQAYGNPVPATVPLTIKKGAFIVVTGHDLRDLKMLLEQTEGKGINIYTHSEMLPAHGYPELKKHSHLMGNFGTAWHNQQKEFDGLPAPILYTTNCIMPPKESYSDRIFTTGVVGYTGLKHIEADSNGNKDFSKLIELSLKLGGYSEDKEFTGINGGNSVCTGFGKNTMLENASAIIDAIKQGAIKHIFLVAGCDGARAGRNYYTEFVKSTPKDTVVLTLACGKYRFNDLDIGSIGAFPRILDMGQCNDAYGAIEVALALANAFNCSVNELPLTLVLSWYEQKAVSILLTLLSLGIKNIYIGPSLPAFLSPTVLQILIEKFNLLPISTPEKDMAAILGIK